MNENDTYVYIDGFNLARNLAPRLESFLEGFFAEITYECSKTIAPAKYDLQRSEYAFQEFERELSEL